MNKATLKQISTMKRYAISVLLTVISAFVVGFLMQLDSVLENGITIRETIISCVMAGMMAVVRTGIKSIIEQFTINKINNDGI